MMKGGRGLWELRDLMRRVGKENKDQEERQVLKLERQLRG